MGLVLLDPIRFVTQKNSESHFDLSLPCRRESMYLKSWILFFAGVMVGVAQAETTISVIDLIK